MRRLIVSVSSTSRKWREDKPVQGWRSYSQCEQRFLETCARNDNVPRHFLKRLHGHERDL